jgi:glycosyltransferase involved in cell wall biosynthesis
MTFVAYDVTRLLTRYAVPTPNGIDRIDIAYARHFLDVPNAARAGTFLYGLQPALFESSLLMPLLAIIDKNWLEGSQTSTTYENVKQILLGVADPPAPQGRVGGFGKNLERRARSLAPLRMLNPAALKRALLERLPASAVFMHTTHYPFEYLFRWLEVRRDVKAVFFIHDLLSLQFPEYFEPRHVTWHRRSLEIFARYGCAAIVNTHVVERQVLDFLHSHGRNRVPVLTLPIPPDPVFSAAQEADLDLADLPYFVMCGTIEPRKNQLMLLQVWRELARRWGPRTPKLVLMGNRGWENENVVDLLDRSAEIRKHVVEIADLPTSALARVIAGARGLLMASFGEGYGLPVVEARAVGTPVIASDIPVFREIAPEATFRHPLDKPGWIAAIEEYAQATPQRSAIRSSLTLPNAQATYFSQLESFIEGL